MPTKYPELFAKLAAPIPRGQVKTRQQGGRTLEYITARVVMNRLDSVLGPECWSDEYEPFGEHGCRCTLKITLPDGTIVTKQGLGGATEMNDASDTDKTSESDALKRAGVKVGIGRELYGDGVADFVAREKGTGDPVQPRQDPSPSRQAPLRQSAPRHQGNDRPPNSGRALFAWASKQKEQTGLDVVKWLNSWAQLQEFPRRMVEFDADQTAEAYSAACKKIDEHTRSTEGGNDEPYEEALAN